MRESEGTVFVVDDDVSVRRSLERLLRAAGYRVESFSSAREFLLRGQDQNTGSLQRGPDQISGCLLLDVRMPEMSGLELRDVLASLGRDIPIIFITGHGDIAMAVQAMKAGAVDFLPKPFDEDVLLAAVAQALAVDRKRHAARSANGPDSQVPRTDE